MRASSAHERHPARSGLPSPPAAPVRRCAHPAARARSGPVPRRAFAGALLAHVRFCGARSAHLMGSKGSAWPVIARRIALAFISWICSIRAILIGRNKGLSCTNVALFPVDPSSCQGRAERVGGAATRGGGGDGGRRGRRQARCRRSGEGRYSDRAGRRQPAPHADAAPRRNPPEPAVRRSDSHTLAQR